MHELDEEPGRPRPRRSFLQRLASGAGWLSMAGSTDTRVEIDALKQYGDEEVTQGPTLLGRIPGWILIALLVAAFVYAVFFTDWI